jgi:hypothetical protein
MGAGGAVKKETAAGHEGGYLKGDCNGSRKCFGLVNSTIRIVNSQR